MTASDQTASLIERVLDAGNRSEPIRVRGGNSKEFLGRSLTGSSVDTSAHTGVVQYEPDELVLTVRSGTTLDEINDVLGEHKQMLGFEPPRYTAQSTIGGTFACNLSGPARPWRGSVRDAVLGLRLINGRGEHLRFGGRVIKNVAGFDASRLQAGAFGTLGIITEISLRVLPAPEASVTLARELDVRASLRYMNELAGTSVPLTGACWANGIQYIRLEGSTAGVAAATRQIGGDRTDFTVWKTLRDPDAQLFGGASAGSLWRFSVSSTSESILPNDVVIDWAGALRYVRAEADLDEMSRLAAKAGGHVMRISHNSDEREFLQQPEPAVRKLHERLKLAFDPGRILNPGRLYGWL